MKSAAESGNPLAQFNYAQLLVANLPGHGGLDAAFPWYQKAADAGIADAQYALSQIYANGTLPSSPTTRRPASGWKRRRGRISTPRNSTSAPGWSTDVADRATQAGLRLAHARRARRQRGRCGRIAKLYRNGVGVDADPVTAAAWYIVAHRAGLTRSRPRCLHGRPDRRAGASGDREGKPPAVICSRRLTGRIAALSCVHSRFVVLRRHIGGRAPRELIRTRT